MSGSPFPPSSRRPSGRGTLVTDDGLHLFTQHWKPDGPTRAVVHLVHGYGEHSGRYAHVAEAMTEAGAAVYTYDQRGYGRSDGQRAYVESFDQYLDDLDHFLSYVAGRTPDLPGFLFGHSMGGLVALRSALTRAPNVDGLILSAPAIEINPDLAPFLRRIAQWLGAKFPRLPTVRSPEGAISRDPDVVEQAMNDPLNYHGRVLARTGAEMIRVGDAVKQDLSRLSLPFFVFHGTADELTDPAWSQRLYEEASATDKTIRLYDGLYHETFNEPERADVLSDLRSWIGDRV
jgi:alpha-beta hydrolase superfamily lysophospholipase